MIRFILFLLIICGTYAFYRRSQNPRRAPETLPKSPCPAPKTFIDYTEGRIKGEKKKAIDSHIARCKDCRDALNGMFNMPTEPNREQVLDRKK